jgi:non-homologous end joining protein Ku
MAARPVWRGHLRLALVSCPVALYNARHDRAGIRFNLINPETGNRIRMITQDAETAHELERRSLAPGSNRQDRQDGAVARGDRAARTNNRPAPDGRWPHGAHALRGSRPQLFDDLAGIKTDPEMVQLATQLVQRQSGKYDSADLEDRYEIRLHAMIDAKLKGEGVDLGEPVEPDRTNVVDLMAALKKSLGQEKPDAAPKQKKTRAADNVRQQPGLKLPIKGGKAALDDEAGAPAATKAPRKRA